MTTRILVCVVGAGTGVGKSFVGAGLLREARRRGMACRGLKPVESGVESRAEDAERLGTACGHVVAPRYAFVDPVSPHLAARRVGAAVSSDEVVRWVEEHAAGLTVVETAGGLLSPLDDEGTTNLDLCARLGPDVVVAVARDELGALHQVASLMLALGNRGLADRTVVVLDEVERGAAADFGNAAELRRVRIVSRVRCVTGEGDFEGALSEVLRAVEMA